MAKGGLGRGLSSLIPQKTSEPKEAKKVSPSFGLEIEESVVEVAVLPEGGVAKIDPKKIKTNPFQPRQRFTDHRLEELMESIKEHGVIQPLVVMREGDDYILIAGERRLRSCLALGLTEVPVVIRDSAGEQEKLELALIENIQREDLNPIETAAAYQILLDKFGLTQEELGKRVGKPRSSIANTLRMMNLPEEIRLALIDGRLTEGHAKYLLGLENEAKQMNLFRKIIHHDLSVKDTSEESKRLGKNKKDRSAKEKTSGINYLDKDKEFAFREFFGTKVEIRRKTGSRGGQIIIDFYDDDELLGMAEKVIV